MFGKMDVKDPGSLRRWIFGPWGAESRHCRAFGQSRYCRKPSRYGLHANAWEWWPCRGLKVHFTFHCVYLLGDWKRSNSMGGCGNSTHWNWGYNSGDGSFYTFCKRCVIAALHTGSYPLHTPEYHPLNWNPPKKGLFLRLPGPMIYPSWER